MMWPILKREVKNYLKKPLFYLGAAIVVLMVYQNVSPYLNIHYLSEGEAPKNDAQETVHDGEIFDGYVPTKEGQRREKWEERVKEVLVSSFEMEDARASSIIRELKGMDFMTACAHLETYGYYDAYYEYVNTAYHKGTREEINAYIREKLEDKAFSYYFSRKFADFAGLFMGFFAAVFLSLLFLQDTKKSNYELLHTKPVSGEKYLAGKVGGGFSLCLILLLALSLIFFALCSLQAGNKGFEVHLTDFLSAACIYILPNMFMIVSIYSLISLVFKSPLPAVPLLILYMVYSNTGSRNAQGVYGYYGRPFAIMVRFPGAFFDTAPPPMALLNQSFLVLAALCITFISMQIWKRRRVY